LDQLLVWLQDVSPYLLYTALGVGAALENIVPLIPADTFVLLGGFFAARGLASAEVVFLVTWAANVLSALVVYTLAYRYGDAFFQTRIGHYVLDPKQVEVVRRFYGRWGVPAIFYTRFLPGLRAVAPVFAGLVRLRPVTVAVPLVFASGIWYGALVWIGAFAGRNIDQLLGIQDRLNWTLTGLAGVIIVLLAWWWLRSRGRHKADVGSEPRPGQHQDDQERPSE